MLGDKGKFFLVRGLRSESPFAPRKKLKFIRMLILLSGFQFELRLVHAFVVCCFYPLIKKAELLNMIVIFSKKVSVYRHM